MHKIRALCLLIRTETPQKAFAGRGHKRLGQNLLRSYVIAHSSPDRLNDYVDNYGK